MGRRGRRLAAGGRCIIEGSANCFFEDQHMMRVCVHPSLHLNLPGCGCTEQEEGGSCCQGEAGVGHDVLLGRRTRQFVFLLAGISDMRVERVLVACKVQRHRPSNAGE